LANVVEVDFSEVGRKRKEVATEMSAIPTYRNRGTPRRHTKRLWMTFMLALAMATAAIAVVAAEAQAGSSSEGFPKPVLMKGNTEPQKGRFIYGTWHYYEAGGWNPVFADGFSGFPRADVVRAGGGLHIRINKPRRPESFTIAAYPRLDEYGMLDDWQSQRLGTTLKRVERDGKTVGWDVFFRVNEDDRHYYLETRGRWERAGHPYQLWDEQLELPRQDQRLK
jgi:hypothetical protein